MKKHFLLLSVIACILFFQTVAQTSVKPVDTMMRYYGRLANSASPSDKAHLEAVLYQLLKSEKEQDWLTAMRFFFEMKKPKISDSIIAADKIKFPHGQLVRNDKADTIYKQKDPVIKEKLYWAWIKNFPPEKFPADQQIIYDYARNSISTAYAEAGNVKKALQFANMVATPAWKGEGWGGTAAVLFRKGHLKEAEELYKKAVNLSYQFRTTRRNDPGAGFAAMGYPGYTHSLAMIYFKQKNYPAALKYIKQAHDSARSINGYTNADYAKILMALHKNQKAFEIIDEAVKEGQATPEMKDDLKTLYVKVKGSNAGYDEYIASVNKLLVEKIRKDVARQMINLPSANFTLKDVNGNTVTLADLRGKVVVLDFWATWCSPCKRSFPAMKMAVERYKDDPNVKFLFIHTWEREEHATDSAKAYITRNNYPFQVLMDLKNAEGINPVVESYKVSGIPTKFVIDPRGNIRFRFTGFSGGDDAAVEEVAAMVDMAKNAK